MSSTEIDGFLSPEIGVHLIECRHRYAAWFDLIRRVNCFGQSVLKDVRIDPIDVPQSIAALLYVRVLGHSQGAVLLIERGMRTQAEVLCRASLEALFALLAVVNRPDTAYLMVKGDRHDRLRLLNASLQRRESLSIAEAATVEAMIEEVNDDLRRDPSSRVTIKCLAERAGLVALYESAYRLLSLSAHSNLRDLERQLGLDQDGNPSSIVWGPILEGLDGSLMLLGDTLIRACTAMAALFNLDDRDDLRTLRNDFERMAATIMRR